VPRYLYQCPECSAEFELERPMAEAAEEGECPVCGSASARIWTMPKLLFKADPRDNRPYWHTHDGYGHSHPPRRGRHRTPEEDH
jgi:putative FmdB family regulatory protein